MPEDGEVAAIRGFTIEEIRSRRFGISPIVATGVFLNIDDLQNNEFVFAFDHGKILDDYYLQNIKECTIIK